MILTTCDVSVDDFVALQEVGKVLNPVLARGQIAGGVAQGMGYALYEKVSLAEWANAERPDDKLHYAHVRRTCLPFVCFSKRWAMLTARLVRNAGGGDGGDHALLVTDVVLRDARVVADHARVGRLDRDAERLGDVGARDRVSCAPVAEVDHVAIAPAAEDAAQQRLTRRRASGHTIDSNTTPSTRRSSPCATRKPKPSDARATSDSGTPR